MAFTAAQAKAVQPQPSKVAPMIRPSALAPASAAAPARPLPQRAADGIEAADILALLRSLARMDSSAINELGDMVEAAMQGRPVDMDVRSLGIDPRLLSRILAATGQQQPPTLTPLEEMIG